jgi:hypothetical protein
MRCKAKEGIQLWYTTHTSLAMHHRRSVYVQTGTVSYSDLLALILHSR